MLCLWVLRQFRYKINFEPSFFLVFIFIFKLHIFSSVQFSCSVVSNSETTPWTAAHQYSLSITNSELAQTHVHRVSDAIQPSHPQPSHPLSSPSPPAFNLSQHQGLSSESVLCIRWPNYWSFSFNISPSKNIQD